MHIFQIITFVIILKQLLTSDSVNKNLDFVSAFIHRYSPRLRRIIACLILPLAQDNKKHCRKVLHNMHWGFILTFMQVVNCVYTRCPGSQLIESMSADTFTLVPEVFLSRERAASSKVARGEKPLVTLDLNVTFMPMPAVKRVKLIITKWTNGNLGITRPLCITNQANQ